MTISNDVLNAALAGLLHDVGKLVQRAGIEIEDKSFNKDDVGRHGYHALLSSEFVKNYVPQHLQQGLSGVLFHHRTDLVDADIQRIRIADHLAAGERRMGSEEQADPREARLIPILSNVELLESPPTGKKHRLSSLTIDQKKTTYPTDETTGDYEELWKQFIDEISSWKRDMDDAWETQSGDDYFTTLLALFQKYLWCVPSATPWQKDEKPRRAWPDVSLYDHNRLTSAIAACLTFDNSLPDENSDNPVALLVRGDVSGIQSFIYRLSRPEAETEHIAKRLRGRSFYLQLLTEVAVDWILREIQLPESCAIFVGGGRFDLLLPLTAKEILHNLNEKLSNWLFDQFFGEIGILLATEQATPSDFSDTRKISSRLDEKLELAKRHKWLERLSSSEFLEPQSHVRDMWHTCKVCQLTPMPDPGQTCPLCSLHERIGKHLPHAKYLVYCYKDLSSIDQERLIRFEGAPFQTQIALIHRKDELQHLSKADGRVKVFAINSTEDFIIPGLASSIRFLANTAPKAIKRFKVEGEPPVEEGDVLHFEAIAELSLGAKRIGVLKADVDRLGLIMSEGLNEEDGSKPSNQRLRPTLSRMASLSRMLDLFFAGHLNRICQEVSDEWKAGKSKHADSVDGLFYILYSGGDDLFIVGPWDQTLHLALRIHDEFYQFTGENKNLTLSAGYIQVKPRYPTQKFAELVGRVEGTAKKEGRNRIAAFGEAMLWKEEDVDDSSDASFQWLLDLAQEWALAIKEKKELPSGLIYDLGGLYRQHRTKDGKLQAIWTPRLYYTLARRLKQEARRKYEDNIFKTIASGKTLAPVSIASLLIRERSE
jgi:CRISPR-associated protein Csm1